MADVEFYDGTVARSEDATPDITADFVMTADVSATAAKKVKLQNLAGTVLATLRSVFTPASSSGAASLKLHEDTDNGTNYSELKGPAALGANQTVTMPSGSGTLALTTDIDAAVVGMLEDKGNQDCSSNPNYPAASKGDVYTVSVAGKIGGGSGVVVEVGDTFRAIADNAGGAQAGVGTSWVVTEHNLVGAYVSGGTDVSVADGGTGSSTAPGALTNLGAQAALLGTFSLANFTIPANNTASAAMGGTIGTLIFGHVSYSPADTQDEYIQFSIETAPGSGSYTVALWAGAGIVAVATGPTFGPFSFFVPTGRKWKHVKSGTPTIALLNAIVL